MGSFYTLNSIVGRKEISTVGKRDLRFYVPSLHADDADYYDLRGSYLRPSAKSALSAFHYKFTSILLNGQSVGRNSWYNRQA